MRWLAIGAALFTSCSTVPPVGSTPTAREVTVTAEVSVRSLARCLVHALDHPWPQLRHAAVAQPDGSYEVRTRERGALVLVNQVRQAGDRLVVATRPQTSAVTPAQWYEGVDQGLDECVGGTDHAH